MLVLQFTCDTRLLEKRVIAVFTCSKKFAVIACLDLLQELVALICCVMNGVNFVSYISKRVTSLGTWILYSNASSLVLNC